MDGREIVEGLRSWARGCYAEEAGVELLVRAFDGRFADRDWPWIRACDRPGWFWVDADAIIVHSGALSGGERRILALVAALIGNIPLEDLGSVVSGLDRRHLQLVLAAVAHAGGSHQHSEFQARDGRVGFDRLPALIGWPTEPVWAA